VKNDQPKELLRNNLDELASSLRHLNYSAEQVASVDEKLRDVTEDQLESVEAFCSRFARTVDLLVNKVLRSLDRVELQAQGTLIDVVNRAEKRGLVDDALDLREMKHIRNVIAHDYAGAKLAEIFSWCREQKPKLDKICAATVAHGRKLL